MTSSSCGPSKDTREPSDILDVLPVSESLLDWSSSLLLCLTGLAGNELPCSLAWSGMAGLSEVGGVVVCLSEVGGVVEILPSWELDDLRERGLCK